MKANLQALAPIAATVAPPRLSVSCVLVEPMQSLTTRAPT